LMVTVLLALQKACVDNTCGTSVSSRESQSERQKGARDDGMLHVPCQSTKG
jgi:hypothetical protein